MQHCHKNGILRVIASGNLKSHSRHAFRILAKRVPVLDDPVVLARLRAVADGQHTVIELRGAAPLLVVDAASVQLERDVAGVDGHADRADGGDGDLQVSLVALLDVDVASVSGANVGCIELAFAVLKNVKISARLVVTFQSDMPCEKVGLSCTFKYSCK